MSLSTQIARIVRLSGLSAAVAALATTDHRAILAAPAVGVLEAAYRQFLPAKDQTKVGKLWVAVKVAYRALDQADPGNLDVKVEHVLDPAVSVATDAHAASTGTIEIPPTHMSGN